MPIAMDDAWCSGSWVLPKRSRKWFHVEPPWRLLVGGRQIQRIKLYNLGVLFSLNFGQIFSTTCNNDDIDTIDSYILRIFWVDSARIQQQKLLADGGFAYVYSGLDADSGDRDFGVQLTNTFKWFEECIPWCFWNQNKAELKTHCIYTGT